MSRWEKSVSHFSWEPFTSPAVYFLIWGHFLSSAPLCIVLNALQIIFSTGHILLSSSVLRESVSLDPEPGFKQRQLNVWQWTTHICLCRKNNVMNWLRNFRIVDKNVFRLSLRHITQIQKKYSIQLSKRQTMHFTTSKVGRSFHICGVSKFTCELKVFCAEKSTLNQQRRNKNVHENHVRDINCI